MFSWTYLVVYEENNNFKTLCSCINRNRLKPKLKEKGKNDLLKIFQIRLKSKIGLNYIFYKVGMSVLQFQI